MVGKEPSIGADALLRHSRRGRTTLDADVAGRLVVACIRPEPAISDTRRYQPPEQADGSPSRRAP